MEVVVVLLTCAFTTFCAADGACTDATPVQLTVNMADDGMSADIWTTPDASGRPLNARVVAPLPTRRGEELHLLANRRDEGAFLLSLRADPSDDGITRARLRYLADHRGDLNGPDVLSAEAACSQTFVRP